MRLPEFKWTLNKKIQLLILVILIVVFATTIIINDRVVRQSVKKDFYSDVETASLLLQQNIESILRDTKSSLEYVKHEFEENDYPEEFIEGGIELLVESNAMILNGFVVYDNGEYLLRPYIELPETFDPRVRSWYKRAYVTRDVNWSQPYEDIATGNFVMTVSLYFQLESRDGVIGTDISLERLPEIISTTQFSSNGYFILVNSQGTVIASSTDEISRNSELMDIEDEEFGTSRLVTGRKVTSKGIYYSRRLNNSDLRLIAFLPNKDLDEASGDAQWISSLVVLLGLFVGLTMSYFLSKRMTKPLEKLICIMNESKYEEDLVLYEGKTNDEIDTLIQSYNGLARNVNEHKGRLQKLSKQLVSSEQKLQEQYIKTVEIAYSDALTGLPNRVKFEEVMKKHINKGDEFAVYYVDLDNFKYINDTYGHSVGDKVLTIVSDRFKKCCHGAHFGARLSGDEFGVLVKDKATSINFDQTAKKILELLHEPIVIEEIEFIITGSIGISIYPDNGVSFEELLSNADIAMYESKNKGKNKYTIYEEELKRDLIYRFNLETRLQHSIDKEELYVNYQPIYNFKTKKIKGFEALVRWRDSKMGMIYPDIFIPIAEHNLFINKIGRFVLEQSIQLATKLYKDKGIRFIMNVNVSVIQLHNDKIVSDIQDVLSRYEYPAKYLNLEITESVTLENKAIIDRLHQLREMGMQISLDDFGTGYSSFNHLLKLPLTQLKIDREVIVTATENEDVYRLIKSVVNFAHTKKLSVVAEGIEDERMETLMLELGVDFAQGYLYSRPLEEDALQEFLQKEPSS